MRFDEPSLTYFDEIAAINAQFALDEEHDAEMARYDRLVDYTPAREVRRSEIADVARRGGW